MADMAGSVNPGKLLALSDEVDAVSALFRHGLSILAEYRFATRDADPVFVCLAGGAEKLLKLTIGLHELEIGQPWPSSKTMRNSWGHKIVALDDQVRGIIKDRVHLSIAPGHIRSLLRQVHSDPVIQQVMATLSRYAEQGRFYNLDALGDKPQPNPSPAQLWEEMHQAMLDDRPGTLAGLASQEKPVWESARRELNDAIINSVRAWCDLIVRAWMTGVVGTQAKMWAPQLDLIVRDRATA